MASLGSESSSYESCDQENTCSEAEQYAFYDYDLNVVQDALKAPHGPEYQDHFGFRVQVKTDDEYDDDTSDDDDANIPAQLQDNISTEKVKTEQTSSSSFCTSSSSEIDNDYDDDDDTDIDTAITTPSILKQCHLSLSSLDSVRPPRTSIISLENAISTQQQEYKETTGADTGYQRRRSSTVSGNSTLITNANEAQESLAVSKMTAEATNTVSKSYRRPRATTLVQPPIIHTEDTSSNGVDRIYSAPLAVCDHDPNADSTCPTAGIENKSAIPSIIDHPHHSTVERPSDVFRNRQSKRFSVLQQHQNTSSPLAISSRIPHAQNRDSAQHKALKEQVSTNLAQLKETSTDNYDWEFWATVIHQFDTVKQHQHQALRQHICIGMPPSLRGMIWQIFTKSRHNCDNTELEYRELLKRVSPHEKIIQRDLARTFPTHSFFRHREGGGQEMLFNVIKAYSLFDPQVGYCQGLPFVVGCLLLHMPDEAAFCVLINLMNEYGLRGHFTPKMDLLHERMFQFDELLLLHLPQVHRHLDAQGVRPTMYASQWFMTLFAYRCPLDLVFRVIDMVFIEGTSIILNVALALMKKNQATLLSLEFEGLLAFLGSDIFDVYQSDASGFVRDTFEFTIQPRELARLSKRHLIKAAQEAKIQGKEDHLRHENYELSQRAKKLEKSYGCLEQEHQELARQVIASKMTMARASDDNEHLRREIALLEQRIQLVKHETEASKQDEFNQLAYENTRLVQRNAQLEDHLADVESTLIEFKVKYAQSENEYEQMKKMLGQIKKISS